MSTEIKGLLEQLLAKLDSYEKRLADLEAKSHTQITLEDYYRKYGWYPGQQPDQYFGWALSPAIPLNFKTTTIC